MDGTSGRPFLVDSTEDLGDGQLEVSEASENVNGVLFTVFHVICFEVISEGWFEPLVGCSFKMY